MNNDVTIAKVLREENAQMRKHIETLEARLRALQPSLYAAESTNITEHSTVEQTAQQALSESTAMQKNLSERQDLLQAILDNAPFPIYARDMQGRYIICNASAAAPFGLTGEQVIGKTNYDLLPTDMAASIPDADQHVLTSGELVQEEAEVLQPDGLHTYTAYWFPIRDAQAKPYAVCGIALDITDRKQAEARLHESEERLRMVLDVTSDGIWDWNMVTGELEVNARWFEMLGYAYGELESHFHTWEQLVYPEDRTAVDPVLADHLAGRTAIFEVEFRLRTKSGDWKWILSRGQVVSRDAEGKPTRMVGTHVDMSERKKREEEQLALQQQIIEAQQTAIRELSTPLLPIASNVIALPLIGSVDSGRAQQIMEVLLNGIVDYQADIAIVDITGIRVIDTQVAQAIIQTARAVKLVGAQVVLTGIQPQIAQTLVHLGVDLGDIVTRSTLEAGIAYALQRNV